MCIRNDKNGAASTMMKKKLSSDRDAEVEYGNDFKKVIRQNNYGKQMRGCTLVCKKLKND